VALPSVLIWRRRSHFLPFLLSELVVGVEDDGEDVSHLPSERGLQEPGGDQVEDEEGERPHGIVGGEVEVYQNP
jgi:hypothetical protein